MRSFINWIEGKYKQSLFPFANVPKNLDDIEIGQEFITPDDKKFALRGINHGKADIVSINDRGSEYPIRMPADSFKHFINDLSQHIDLPAKSGNPTIDKLLKKQGEFLGKGNDGLAFKVGDKIVKVSTTVPFHMINPFHRTPEEAISHSKNEAEISKELIRRGVEGILPVEYVEYGDKAFQIKPFVQMLDENNIPPAVLEQLKQIVKQVHEAGYVINDEIQVGMWNGKPYIVDLGTSRKSRFKDDKTMDLERLQRLFLANNVKMLPTGDALREKWEHYIFIITETHNKGWGREGLESWDVDPDEFPLLAEEMYKEFPQEKMKIAVEFRNARKMLERIFDM